MLKQGRNLPWKAAIKTKTVDPRYKGSHGRPSLPVLPVYEQQRLEAQDKRQKREYVKRQHTPRPTIAEVDFDALVMSHLSKHAYSTLRIIAKSIGRGLSKTRFQLHRLVAARLLFCDTSRDGGTILFSLSRALLPKPVKRAALPKKPLIKGSARVADCVHDIRAYLGIHPRSSTSAITLFLRKNIKRVAPMLNILEKKGVITRAYEKDKPDVLWSLLTP